MVAKKQFLPYTTATCGSAKYFYQNMYNISQMHAMLEPDGEKCAYIHSYRFALQGKPGYSMSENPVCLWRGFPGSRCFEKENRDIKVVGLCNSVRAVKQIMLLPNSNGAEIFSWPLTSLFLPANRIPIKISNTPPIIMELRTVADGHGGKFTDNPQ